MTPLAPLEAARQVGCDPVEKSLKPPLLTVARRGVEEAEEGVLSQLLPGVPPGKAAQVVDQVVLVAVDQHRQGLAVAAPHPGHELAVGGGLEGRHARHLPN